MAPIQYRSELVRNPSARLCSPWTSRIVYHWSSTVRATLEAHPRIARCHEWHWTKLVCASNPCHQGSIDSQLDGDIRSTARQCHASSTSMLVACIADHSTEPILALFYPHTWAEWMPTHDRNTKDMRARTDDWKKHIHAVFLPQRSRPLPQSRLARIPAYYNCGIKDSEASGKSNRAYLDHLGSPERRRNAKTIRTRHASKEGLVPTDVPY